MGFEYIVMVDGWVSQSNLYPPKYQLHSPPGKMQDLLFLFNNAYLWLFLYPSAKKSKALVDIASRLAPHTTYDEKVQEISTNSKYL